VSFSQEVAIFFISVVYNKVSTITINESGWVVLLKYVDVISILASKLRASDGHPQHMIAAIFEHDWLVRALTSVISPR
jgi:hypothetical protein